MPQSVLGGAAVMMFSSIVISGIQLITKEPLSARNLSIVSVALGVGYGMGANPGILANALSFYSLFLEAQELFLRQWLQFCLILSCLKKSSESGTLFVTEGTSLLYITKSCATKVVVDNKKIC